MKLPLGLVVFAICPALAAQEPAKIDFAHEILPVLKARCVECHANGKYKGGFSLDTRAEMLKSKAVVPGKSGQSELFTRIASADPETRMPPKGDPLTAKQIQALKRWIDEGATWEPGFSFKTSVYVPPLKPRRPTLPDPTAGREHPIDRILGVYFDTKKVTPPAPLDDLAFVRRIYLDLIGLLPTPAEVDAFLYDATADKRQRLISRLLAEKRNFSDHWLSFWNDLLRNDYAGPGFTTKGRKQITDWLYQAIQNNKPYDQMVRELIHPKPESEGFILGITWRGNVNASQVPELQFSQNVSQVFFGINMKCASCHDSFIDTWKLDDAYALAAVVASKPLEMHRCDKKIDKLAQARFLWPELGSIDPKQSRDERLARFAELVTHPENGRFTRTIVNRIWQRLMGRGIVHPVDIMANPPWSDDLLDYLAVFLADEKYDLKRLIEHIATSRTYQSRPVPQSKEPVGDDYIFRGPEVRRLSAEQFIDALWMTTHGGPVKAAAPVKLPAFDQEVPRDRQLIRAALVKSDPLMRSLGRPNREQVVTTRPDQLTTLQALDLSNGKILSDMIDNGAKALLKSRPKWEADAVIEELFLRLLCRKPSAEERAPAREIVGNTPREEGVADLMWTLLMLPEFQLIR